MSIPYQHGAYRALVDLWGVEFTDRVVLEATVREPFPNVNLLLAAAIKLVLEERKEGKP